MTDWFAPPYRMISGQGVVAEHVYEKIEGGRGVWLVASDVEDRGSYCYFHDPKDTKSDGFGGATLTFKLNDGGQYIAKGPWHGNAEACYNDTGHDFRNMYRTFVVLSMDRKCEKPDCLTRFVDVIYKDPDGGLLGSFDRYKELSRQYPEAMYYYSESQGGSSNGPTETWRRLHEKKSA